MKKVIYISIIFLTCQFCFTAIPSFAVYNDPGLWAPTYILLPVNDKFKVNLEINPRIQKNIGHLNQLFVRPSVGYQLTENLSVWQGYGWITNYIPRFVREERIWQQILHEKHFSKFTLINRLRLEERFIQDINGVPLRMRYLVRFEFPFGKTKKWAFVTSDEPFINLDTHFKGPKAGVDQNRFFVGLNRKLSNTVTLEGGYQMQYLNRRSPMQDKLNHIILINMYFNLPQLIKSK